FAPIDSRHLMSPILISRKIVCPRRQGIAELRTREILWACFLPLDHAETGRIINDASSPDGQAGSQAHVPIHLGYAAVNVSELPLPEFKNGNICLLADR